MYSENHLALARLRKDLSDLSDTPPVTSSSSTTVVVRPLHLHADGPPYALDVTMKVLQGAYKGGTFEFVLEVPSLYPFKPPRIRAKAPIYHPNVNLATGEVALSVLGSGWRPVLSVGGVVLCLEMMFLEPTVGTGREVLRGGVQRRRR